MFSIFLGIHWHFLALFLFEQMMKPSKHTQALIASLVMIILAFGSFPGSDKSLNARIRVVQEHRGTCEICKALELNRIRAIDHYEKSTGFHPTSATVWPPLVLAIEEINKGLVHSGENPNEHPGIGELIDKLKQQKKDYQERLDYYKSTNKTSNR
jgi:hypothetical protein